MFVCGLVTLTANKTRSFSRPQLHEKTKTENFLRKSSCDLSKYLLISINLSVLINDPLHD